MTPYYEDEAVTIYHGDYRELLGAVRADVTITDPPYGVGLDYQGEYDDEEQAYADVVLTPFSRLLRAAPLTLVTPGIGNMWKFPEPRWAVAWHKPGSTRRSKIRGFNIWEPVLVYGEMERPVWQDAVTLPTITNIAEKGETGSHPCPKPYSLMTWLIEQFTSPNDVIFDPFMGSGTTIKAAAHMGRRAIGCEVVEDYCQVAVDRLAQQVLPLEAS